MADQQTRIRTIVFRLKRIDGYRQIECDEIWAFVYAKERRVRAGLTKATPNGTGNAWTFTAIDAGSKIILSYLAASATDRPRSR